MMHAVEAHHQPASVLESLSRVFLLVLMVAGSLLMWVGVPAGWLWLAGQITESPASHFALSLIGAPVAIIAWARGLFWLNRLYLRIPGGVVIEDDADLDDDDEEEPRWLRGPLEPILVATLALALITMLYWFFVLAENPGAWLS